MKVDQLSVTLDTEAGSIVDVANVLAGNGINIMALSLADTTPKSIMRFIVNDAAYARSVLEENGFKVETSEVLVLEVPDKPGGLASVLKALTDADLSVEYLYAFSQRTGETGLIIFRIKAIDEAVKALNKAGIRVVSSSEICTA